MRVEMYEARRVSSLITVVTIAAFSNGIKGKTRVVASRLIIPLKTCG